MRAGKQDAIREALRREIVGRRLPGGAQLPSHTALAKRFHVSTATIRTVLSQMAREGLVHTKWGHGTYVADRLPHLRNYGLVFWNDPASPFTWSKFYAALVSEALVLQQREGRQFQFFYGIDGHVDTEDRQRLVDQLCAHRLAGLILVNEGPQSAAAALLEDYEVPRVALSGQRTHADIPAVKFNPPLFLERAVACLARQGCKRIAHLGIGIERLTQDALAKAAAEWGVDCPLHWQQAVSQAAPIAASRCVQLLLQGAKSARPDGLIIGDDNLVEHALAGVVTAGVRVPADLEVVAHCNFPWPAASVLPVHRLGFDVGHALRVCVELIDRQGNGEAVPGTTTLPARFEEELSQAAELVCSTDRITVVPTHQTGKQNPNAGERLQHEPHGEKS